MSSWYTERKSLGKCVTWKCNNDSVSDMVRCASCLKGAAAAIIVRGIPETMLAYMAGIVDGEGCIAIRKSSYKNRKTGEIRRFYHCEIVIVNASLSLINLFKYFFGGHVHTRSKVKSHHQQTYSWHLGYRAGLAFLEKILPYLLVKKEQAEISIDCQKLNDSRVSSEVRKNIRSKQVLMFERVKELKRAS